MPVAAASLPATVLWSAAIRTSLAWAVSHGRRASHHGITGEQGLIDPNRDRAFMRLALHAPKRQDQKGQVSDASDSGSERHFEPAVRR
jgi:hypothetical protein